MEGNMAKINEGLAEDIAGRGAPKSFPVLDASIMDYAEVHRAVRDDVKHNNIEFQFPSGFNKLSLFEECRAYTLLDDFDAMYDITMQMLVDKDLIINLKDDDGTAHEMCSIHVVDKFQNLRGDDFIDEYPVVITWLCEFVAEMLAKKYPLPGSVRARPAQATKSKKGPAKKKSQ